MSEFEDKKDKVWLMTFDGKGGRNSYTEYKMKLEAGAAKKKCVRALTENWTLVRTSTDEEEIKKVQQNDEAWYLLVS